MPDLKALIADHVVSNDLLGIQKTREHNKRANPVTKILRVVLHYSCPASGPQVLTMKWSASYNFYNHHLDFQALEGLERFQKDEVEISQNNFSATLRHSHCHGDGHRSCTYRFKAQTFGTIYYDTWGMEMDYIRVASHPDDQPNMTEYCEYLPRVIVGSNCSMTPLTRESAKCTITKTDITAPTS